MGELESRIAQGYVKSHLDTMPTARECRKVLKIISADFDVLQKPGESIVLSRNVTAHACPSFDVGSHNVIPCPF